MSRQWSFRHKGREAFYRTGSTKGIQSAYARKLGMILAMLDVAKEPQDLNQPGLRLHPLKGHSAVWKRAFDSDYPLSVARDAFVRFAKEKGIFEDVFMPLPWMVTSSGRSGMPA
ncbi:type II toxin-antitoxin system RelE/ParE family toxin [Pseudaminobacter soli (ex Li et al. 2025)]|uniref:Uncharacterized protein n=1 Tax=Pseudaminobacter soli (ex Li et al. 2025) TaxID=1295366 RepID=A0A2P7RMD7_9HYPH|nr:type II toxin-antitoxin system RelE/ParE family toxin [Mesorhizobium soli]PSJ51388.1 hypothetical protein C7I85_29600 [Mesorhizobium soli]